MKNNMSRIGWLLILMNASPVWAGTEIQSLDFKDGLATSELTIQAPVALQFTKSRNEADRQLVIDIEGASLGPNATRRLDTSSFNTPVSLISPYVLDDKPETVRIVLQFREALTDVSVVREGSNLKVQISKPNSQPAPGSHPLQTESTPEGNPPDLDLPLDERLAQNLDGPGITTDPRLNPIDQFIEDRETQRFRGTPITVNVREAQVKDVLRLIGETSGFNMVVGDQVTGTLSLSLENVPWDQVLDVVLQSMNLGAERNQNVLRIQTLTSLTREKEEQLRAEQAANMSAPKVTRIFPINYADPSELQGVLQQFGSGTANGGRGRVGVGDGGVLGQTGNIGIDTRTNSLIVQDTVENVARMEKLIGLLDVETQQVLIEGRVIEASETFAESLNGQFGIGLQGGGGEYFTSFNGSDPTAGLIGDVNFGGGAGSGASNIGLSPDLGFITNGLRLNAFLNIQESESEVNVIASPRIIVLNGQSASINASTPTAIVQPGNAFQPPTVVTSQANLTLEVTPTVTNDERVRMTLNLTRDVPQVSNGQQLVANRTVQTQVLVKSGSTLVIGGIYESQTTKSEFGFPYLRKIPILGWLFGGTTNEVIRRELFYFVTPRILNRQTSGTVKATVKT